jgi:hypothetical protein
MLLSVDSVRRELSCISLRNVSWKIIIKKGCLHVKVPNISFLFKTFMKISKSEEIWSREVVWLNLEKNVLYGVWEPRLKQFVKWASGGSIYNLPLLEKCRDHLPIEIGLILIRKRLKLPVSTLLFGYLLTWCNISSWASQRSSLPIIITFSN